MPIIPKETLEAELRKLQAEDAQLKDLVSELELQLSDQLEDQLAAELVAFLNLYPLEPGTLAIVETVDIH